MPMRKPKDPLEAYAEGVKARRGAREKPIPLTSTSMSVRIEGGLAVVETERVFRNVEDESIEATMTFPIPVDAVMTSLKAVIEGRTVVAKAKAVADARQAYEGAMERGKATILHEELLRGVHMLSVGHIRPKGEVAVTSAWVAPLSFLDGSPRLRIPTTVGEIFGRSPLRDSDDLISGGPRHLADITIECIDGVAALRGAGPSTNGKWQIGLDAPIDIIVSNWKAKTLQGIAADGRKVTVKVTPAPKADAAIDARFLSDRSDSMSERASGDAEINGSKFDHLKAGAIAFARAGAREADRLEVFEFASSFGRVGSGTGPRAIEETLSRLRTPSGGTSLGHALNAILASEGATDLVIATDGKTYDVDVQAAARLGVRVNVVLIGEDSLEGHVGHLAGLTGGQVFVAQGDDTDLAIAAAFEAARLPRERTKAIDGEPKSLTVCRRGARIEITWGAKAKGKGAGADRSVAAFAASLAIPLMDKDRAAAVAEAEGIVCHLTSLVLVDEAGEAQEGLPATRKIALSTPRTALMGAMAGGFASAPDASVMFASSDLARASFHAGGVSGRSARIKSSLASRSMFGAHNPLDGLIQDFTDTGANTGLSESDILRAMRRIKGRVSSQPPAPPPSFVGLEGLAEMIDWDDDPQALRQGDLGGLSEAMANIIRRAAESQPIITGAKAAGLDPIVFVIALLARASAHRSAARLAKACLSSADMALVEVAAHAVGLPPAVQP